MNKRKQMADYHDQFVVLAETKTLPQICKILDLSANSVDRYLKKLGILCVSDRTTISEHHDRIIDLVNKSYNLSEIAKELNINSGSIRSYLKSKSINLLKSRNGVKALNIPINYKSSYYVYGHYLGNGKLFYVGKGIRGRKDNTFGRSKEWKLFTEANSWYSEIIIDGLTESEALLKENEIMNSVPGLLNIRLNSFELELKDLENTFYYDSTSPSCLRWKVWNNQKNESKRLPNDAAGTLSRTKYNVVQGYKVGFNNKEYKAHRVVLYLHGIDCKGKIVDHIDGNPCNNRLENLRVIDQAENCRNLKLRIDNKTGVSGLDLIKIGSTWFYRAKVTIVGNHLSQQFSVSKYGLIPAFYKACEWRKEQIRLLNEQGAGYTERHGT